MHEPATAFDTLYEAIRKGLDEQNDRLLRQLRTFSTAVQAHLLLLTFCTFLAALFFLTPVVGLWLQMQIDTLVGRPVFTGSSGLLAVLAFAGWLVIVIGPIPFIRVRTGWLRNALSIAYSVLVLPCHWVLLDGIPRMLAGGGFQWATALQVWLLAAVFFFAFLPMLYGLLFIMSSGMARTLFVALASTSAHGVTKLVPSHSALNRELCTSGADVTATWPPELTRQVGELATQRQEALNSQAQALSFVLAAVGLVGLLGLVVSAEQVIGIINWLGSLLTQQPTDINPNAPVQIAIGLAVLLIIFASFYFMSIYINLRVIEVMRLLCARSEPAAVPQPTAAPAQPQRPALWPGVLAVLLYMLYRLLRKGRRG